MDKKEVVLVGIVAIIALLIMFFIEGSITGKFIFGDDYEIEDYYEERTFEKPWYVEGLPGMPRLPQLPFGPKKYADLPPKQDLVPDITEYRVNNILVPQVSYFAFIPVREEKIRTHAGVFGPYYNDPSQYIAVFLCTYAHKIPKSAMRCERMETGFGADGFVSFTRGYAPDEYIGYQAVGRDFTSLYIIANDEYGIIEVSSAAPIKLIKD